MLPIDSVSGKFWGPENSKAALLVIRAGCLTDLHSRDLSRGIPANGRVYREADGQDPDTPGRFEVDVELARKKHTGKEFTTLLSARWSDFCSESKDENAWVKEHRADDRGNAIKDSISAAKGVEASFAEVEAPKRRPGRPRKEKPEATELKPMATAGTT